jgi:hypothetical protein
MFHSLTRVDVLGFGLLTRRRGVARRRSRLTLDNAWTSVSALTLLSWVLRT